jgi:hypothetical protein
MDLLLGDYRLQQIEFFFGMWRILDVRIGCELSIKDALVVGECPETGLAVVISDATVPNASERKRAV